VALSSAVASGSAIQIAPPIDWAKKSPLRRIFGIDLSLFLVYIKTINKGVNDMTNQIAAALNVAAQFITNVKIEGKYVDFDLNGVGYWAKLSRGQFNPDNMRRA
jgi:hypothetical protein